MGVIRFKYNLNPEIQPLLQETIVDYTDDFVYGMVDEGHTSDLRHCSLYLICPEKTVNGMQINMTPIVVAARNTEEASQLYEEEMHTNCYVVAELESRCDNIKVEPV